MPEEDIGPSCGVDVLRSRPMPSKRLGQVRSSPRRSGRVTQRALRKSETHERIVASACEIARREGLRAASVTRVMAGAGLTVGGFYAHFASKTQMDVEVVRTLLGIIPSRWRAVLYGSIGFEGLVEALQRYLSTHHRDAAVGCPYPAVLSDAVGASPAIKHAFAEALDMAVRVLEKRLPQEGNERERALATIALMIGGLTLAKASAGSSISDEILDACRDWALPEVTEHPRRLRQSRAQKRAGSGTRKSRSKGARGSSQRSN